MKKLLLNSFSGGETSAFMSKLLKVHPAFADYRVVNIIANTGKENKETLEFADKCDKHFDLNLVWVEAVIHPERGIGTTHRVVTFETADRDGKRYEEMLAKFGLPSKAFPHCTRELKLRPIHHYMRTHHGDDYVTAIGIRDDERHRISKDPAFIYPLATVFKVDKPFINHWWSSQPFRLELPRKTGTATSASRRACAKSSRSRSAARTSPSGGPTWSSCMADPGPAAASASTRARVRGPCRS